ncbi:MAG: hypothetical protein M0Z41_14030, partial [Peptococcaceae bacterium]|nr:hypothetical protein [Peptococcaceae bacterium]
DSANRGATVYALACQLRLFPWLIRRWIREAEEFGRPGRWAGIDQDTGRGSRQGGRARIGEIGIYLELPDVSGAVSGLG